jgi:adenosylmethionine-8-amino-7-oxononanoate aminotransferase
MSSLWHPFADMASVKDDEFVVSRGSGARVWDEAGREYIDAKGGLWYCSIGHGRGEIADAVSAQMRELAVYDVFAGTANRPAIELADRVAALAPFADGAVFFTSGGSDAVDTAGKLALRYWHALGKPDKRTIVHRERSYHGMNAYGTSLAGIAANREGIGALIPDTASVGSDDTEALEHLFAERGDRIAAFIGEPVIGAGGIYAPAPGYWQRVQELCRAHDVLLIADEVICGFGRLGTWFGCHRFGITPDMITCAKGITSGYLPLGAVIASPRLQEPFWTTPGAALFPPRLHVLRPPQRVRGRARQPRRARARGAGRARLAARAGAGRGHAAARGAAAGERGAKRRRPAGRRRGRAGRARRRARGRRSDRQGLPRARRAHARPGRHSLQVSPAFVIDEAEIGRIAEVFAETLSSVSVGTGV